MAKSSKTTTTTEIGDHAKVVACLRELGAQRSAVCANIIALERRGIRAAPSESAHAPSRQVEALARQLLNGTANLLTKSTGESPSEILAAQRQTLAAIDRAIVLGREIELRVRGEEAAKRVEQRRAEWNETMTAICRAVIQLEHCLQQRDRLAHEIDARDRLNGVGWVVLAGRLSNRAGGAYTFLRAAVDQNWIDLDTLEKEVKRARDAEKS